VNGEIFDQSRRTADAEPFMFRLGQGQVIKGTYISF
jgi:FKBP-type peptidyl-prolyl cis-trans isomerase